MKVEITKTQIESIEEIKEVLKSMIGCSDGDEDKSFKRHIRNIDRFLKKNKL